MSTPGWYPDPSGAPGRYRYWDGRTWSQQTSDQPGRTPPGGRERRRTPLIIGALALVLVIGLIIVFVTGQLGDRPVRITDAPVPTETVTGWDDSSPTATPSPSPSPTPSPSPSSSPSPTPSPSGSSTARPLTECPTGDPLDRKQHPIDDRVHGGGLSFPRLPDWDEERPNGGISWAYDVSSQSQTQEPGWFSLLAVGELRRSDGFAAPRQAAESVVQCVASSSFYAHFTGTDPLKSEAVTIDGRQGWWIRTDIRIDDPEIEADGDTVDVIVVDTGRPGTFGLYLGAGTIGDQRLLAVLDSTKAGLRVD
ncbi:DUF2510 domain-containing protein [Microlunatus parietis]|uniref:DUF2510 domain-containing protein n=1 Tax=Microlunatus parietis TaxID=682979 RepID=A0A7Y9LEB9_9ACTN|nr:DUF2510 domain-containing protein [Microlunatus parietis]NYE73678.1 hypothetical protein [Microlunatus parietis]